MANTFTKIASVTVGSGGASTIDFSSISSSYTDLCLLVCVRTSYSGIEDYIKLSFNSVTTNLSDRRLYGNGASAASANDTAIYCPIIGDTATANTFANTIIYIPNYAGSNYKSVSVDSVGETNATTVYGGITAGLWSSTSAITAVNLTPFQSGTFKQYSTAVLYGIKNA